MKRTISVYLQELHKIRLVRSTKLGHPGREYFFVGNRWPSLAIQLINPVARIVVNKTFKWANVVELATSLNWKKKIISKSMNLFVSFDVDKKSKYQIWQEHIAEGTWEEPKTDTNISTDKMQIILIGCSNEYFFENGFQ